MAEMEPNPEDKVHNQNVKFEIMETLKKLEIDISGVRVPLLSKNTEQIVFDINEGKIAFIRPLYKIK